MLGGEAGNPRSLSSGHAYWAQAESETSVAKAERPCRVRETLGSGVTTQLWFYSLGDQKPLQDFQHGDVLI